MYVYGQPYAYVYIGEFVCEYIALSKIFTLPFSRVRLPASKAALLAQCLPHCRSFVHYLPIFILFLCYTKFFISFENVIAFFSICFYIYSFFLFRRESNIWRNLVIVTVRRFSIEFSLCKYVHT